MRRSIRLGLLVIALSMFCGCSQPSETITDASAGTPRDATKTNSRDSSLPEGRLVDLTHTFDESTIYWPTEEGFKFVKKQAGLTGGGATVIALPMKIGGSGGPLRIVAIVP